MIAELGHWIDRQLTVGRARLETTLIAVGEFMFDVFPPTRWFAERVLLPIGEAVDWLCRPARREDG